MKTGKEFVVVQCPTNEMAKTHKVFISTSDFHDGHHPDIHWRLTVIRLQQQASYLYTNDDRLDPGTIALNKIQREDLGVAVGDTINGEILFY